MNSICNRLRVFVEFGFEYRVEFLWRFFAVLAGTRVSHNGEPQRTNVNREAEWNTQRNTEDKNNFDHAAKL